MFLLNKFILWDLAVENLTKFDRLKALQNTTKKNKSKTNTIDNLISTILVVANTRLIKMMKGEKDLFIFLKFYKTRTIYQTSLYDDTTAGRRETTDGK